MGYCMPIMNFNFMQPMPFFGFNFMPQIPMFPSLFGMFNPMQFNINANPWAMMGWQPSYNYAPVVPNFSLFNQPANLFNAQPVNYFNNCNFYSVAGNNNKTKVNSDNTTVKINTTSNKTSPLNLSDSELTAYGFDTPEKRAGFRQLKPQMQRAVIELSDYAKSQGIKITYGSKRSIFRTRAEQEAIYRTTRPGFAAKPGYSRHESGEAVDISIPGANKNSKNDPQYRKLAEKWQSMGYTWGGTWKHCEPWHFDLRPNKGC